ncbi:hypothetical protein ACFSGX_06630 [Sphingomonas arantia]|uniref:Uncharacterized protein n=1 Tax=Sphingomonas arantia TaxID=1460676 RepID=A0ABW4TX32_9SPHN
MLVFLAIAAAATPVTDPPAVRALIDRRTACNHWSGEEPYDPARARQIEHAIRTLRCDTLDADERRLKIRYRGDPHILQRLATDR